MESYRAEQLRRTGTFWHTDFFSDTVSKMYLRIEGYDVDAVSSFDCLLKFRAEREMLANMLFHVNGHATAENYCFYPSRIIGNFDKFRILRNSPHRVTREPPILPFVGPAIQLYE